MVSKNCLLAKYIYYCQNYAGVTNVFLQISIALQYFF